jgi:acyl-CoA thioester hydrolase
MPIATRWKDNDAYHHVNNVSYYEFMDSVINMYLIKHAGLRLDGPVIGLCVNSSCDYMSPLEYPGTVDAGLQVSKLGNSSVQYTCGIFGEGATEAAAVGTFTHVFVSADERKATPIPDDMRAALKLLLVTQE